MTTQLKDLSTNDLKILVYNKARAFEVLQKELQFLHQEINSRESKAFQQRNVSNITDAAAKKALNSKNDKKTAKKRKKATFK